MRFRNRLTIVLILVLLVMGVWSIGQTGRLSPESPLRRQLLSTAGTLTLQQNPIGEPLPEPEVVFGGAIDLTQPLPPASGGDSQYERWQNGEIDLENEGLVSEAEQFALQAAALKLPVSEQIQNPAEGPIPAGPVKAQSFDSLDVNDCCGGGANVPPDPEMAVGANHIIAAVNVAIEMYNKSGDVVLPPTTFATLFSGVSGCTSDLFDPNVLYDESTGRFFLGIDANGDNYCMAASATNNPVGVWYRYRIATHSDNSALFFDYPHAGVGRTAIYMGANMFNRTTRQFVESRVWAFNKAAMYAGQPTVATVWLSLSSSEDTPQPANLHGYAQGTWPTSGPHYFITETNFNGATYSVFAWNDPFGANTLLKTGTFNLVTATGVAAGFPIDAPQAGSSLKLMANDWRAQDAEYRNGYLWTSNTVACNPGGGTVDCVRWAQVNPVNGTIVQAGVLGSPGEYRIFADLAANHCNDMAIGYTKTSPAIFPGIWVAGRDGSDPAGTVEAEQVLKAGEVPYSAFNSLKRWGDYTGMTSDPNGRDFWYIGQYSKNLTNNYDTTWGNYIGCYVPPNCSPPLPALMTGSGVEAMAGLNPLVYLPLTTNPMPPALPCGYAVNP
jgi:hypothetical protein